MAVSLTIAAGKINVALPNGVLAQAGQVVTLTDSDFAKIPAANLYGGASALFTAAPTVVAGTDGVTTQGSLITLTAAAPAAQTSAAAVGSTPTKAEFDKTVADITALRTTVAAAVVDVTAVRTNLTGVGKALAAS